MYARPYLVDFIATNVVSGNAKAFDFGAIRVDLIEVNVDLSLQISMDMSMHISGGYPWTYHHCLPREGKCSSLILTYFSISHDETCEHPCKLDRIPKEIISIKKRSGKHAAVRKQKRWRKSNLKL